MENLTKLAAAKDVAAWHGLTAADGNNPIAYAHYEPLDDASVAERMMKAYSERGLDPSMALDADSDPLQEFGGSDALFGKSN